MDLLAYVLIALSLLATIGLVIEAPMVLPLFILFWCVILWIGARVSRRRDGDPDQQDPRRR